MCRQETGELSDFLLSAALLAESKQGSLLRLGKGNKKGCKAIQAIRRMAPPVVVKANEKNGVVLETFTFAARHQRDLVIAFEDITPLVRFQCAVSHGLQMLRATTKSSTVITCLSSCSHSARMKHG